MKSMTRLEEYKRTFEAHKRYISRLQTEIEIARRKLTKLEKVFTEECKRETGHLYVTEFGGDYHTCRNIQVCSICGLIK